MKQSSTVPNAPSSLKSGSVIPTIWYEDLEEEVSLPLRERPLLVLTRPKRDVLFDTFCSTVRNYNPLHVVPPYSLTDQNYTSAAAERVRAQGKLTSAVGVVMCGHNDAEELDFLVWAHTKGYAPIVIPPDRRPRCWQIQQIFAHGAIGSSWYHLPGNDRDLDVAQYPGLWTWGEPL